MFLFLLAQAAPVPPKPVEIDFPTFNLTAPTAGPSVEVVRERPPAHFPPAVKVRTDFKEEMAQSANEVR